MMDSITRPTLLLKFTWIVVRQDSNVRHGKVCHRVIVANAHIEDRIPAGCNKVPAAKIIDHTVVQNDSVNIFAHYLTPSVWQNISPVHLLLQDLR